MRRYLPFDSLDLGKDWEVPGFAGFLMGAETGWTRNAWIGDGRTRGRLHFDEYENILFQVCGTKQFTTFRPDAPLYEGHIREAYWRYSAADDTFAALEPMDSTSLVMSPIDLDLVPDSGIHDQVGIGSGSGSDPDHGFEGGTATSSGGNIIASARRERAARQQEEFPAFTRQTWEARVTCTVGSGEALYVPAFHWHDVHSFPEESNKECASFRNLAVNLWAKPLFEKEFPCKECPEILGKTYNRLIESHL